VPNPASKLKSLLWLVLSIKSSDKLIIKIAHHYHKATRKLLMILLTSALRFLVRVVVFPLQPFCTQQQQQQQQQTKTTTTTTNKNSKNSKNSINSKNVGLISSS
jgi:hypothetical protein